MSTDHNFWKERRAEADSNRGPSAYQANALPLGQTGSRTAMGMKPDLLSLRLVQSFRGGVLAYSVTMHTELNLLLSSGKRLNKRLVGTWLVLFYICAVDRALKTNFHSSLIFLSLSGWLAGCLCLCPLHLYTEVHLRMYLWWSLCTLYLHACQVRVTVGDSGLCCCTCVTYFEH